MNVFIDESGRFRVHEGSTGKTNYECIVGLIVNDSLLIALEERYECYEKKELRQQHAEAIISMLVEHKAKAFVIVYDAGCCTKVMIEKMRKTYINSIYEGKNHPDWMLESVDTHAKNLENLSSEAFIKALFTLKLLENILRGIVGQSNQFGDEDLKEFPIIVDDMTARLIPTIKYFVSFALFCYAAEKPLDLDNPQKVAHLIHSDDKYLNGREFFKSINFSESKESLGIRIVDVVANQIYRLFRREVVCDISLLSKLFSSSYSLDMMHLDLGSEFKDATDVNNNDAVMQWINGLPLQINLEVE